MSSVSVNARCADLSLLQVVYALARVAIDDKHPNGGGAQREERRERDVEGARRDCVTHEHADDVRKRVAKADDGGARLLAHRERELRRQLQLHRGSRVEEEARGRTRRKQQAVAASVVGGKEGELRQRRERKRTDQPALKARCAAVDSAPKMTEPKSPDTLFAKASQPMRASLKRSESRLSKRLDHAPYTPFEADATSTSHQNARRSAAARRPALRARSAVGSVA